jgi:hypothetical protein
MPQSLLLGCSARYPPVGSQMAAAIESTVIAWHENAREWLNSQHGILLPVPNSSPAQFESVLAAAQSIDPFPWDGGMSQGCYDNVTHLVVLFGGEPVYGWGLADVGPLSIRGKRLPLYARWINHVVWRDGGGKLWEVTPRFEVGNLSHTGWRPTTFAVDSDASFMLNDNEESIARPSRFVALRAEGEHVAELLNRAEHADSEADRTRLLVMALAEMASRGFTPKECRVETIGTRTINIWLIAE